MTLVYRKLADAVVLLIGHIVMKRYAGVPNTSVVITPNQHRSSAKY